MRASLLAGLGWGPGRRVGIDTDHGVVIVAADPDGAHRIDPRGTPPLPSAARQVCRIPAPTSVVLAAVAVG